ncbi:helix-turn-helix domain-containing protein [Halobellus rubicundus]|uniref:Helix-turn-helix domain-containing protein n=1 Tax=Halobellus rubicundus TaxID=2996466 RepID=A0ABD5MD38_9EURY
MSSNPLSDALTPDPESVFAALADPQCRALLRALDRPKTATELADAVEMPRSTAYEKLRRLADAGLVRKRETADEVRYAIDFETVVVRTDDDDDLSVSVSRPSKSAAEQLTGMWREVRSEASGD